MLLWQLICSVVQLICNFSFLNATINTHVIYESKNEINYLFCSRWMVNCWNNFHQTTVRSQWMTRRHTPRQQSLADHLPSVETESHCRQTTLSHDRDQSMQKRWLIGWRCSYFHSDFVYCEGKRNTWITLVAFSFICKVARIQKPYFFIEVHCTWRDQHSSPCRIVVLQSNFLMWYWGQSLLCHLPYLCQDELGVKNRLYDPDSLR